MSDYTFRTETVTRNGVDYVVEYENETDQFLPWEEDEGHGPVSDWTTRDKKPGELVLASDRGLNVMLYATFERFEIALTKEDVLPGSHPGQCDKDIIELVKKPYIREQLDAIPFDSLRSELREYGAWDEVELANDRHNARRILWLACVNIREELANEN